MSATGRTRRDRVAAQSNDEVIAVLERLLQGSSSRRIGWWVVDRFSAIGPFGPCANHLVTIAVSPDTQSGVAEPR